jgi:glycosyltransferase involved in cell wall biosynthesis
VTGRLRVGVDLCGIDPGAVGPTEHAVLELLGAVGQVAPDDVEVVLFASRQLAKARPEVFRHLEAHTLPLPLALGPLRLLTDRAWLPRAVRRARLDVLHHATGTPTVPAPVPRILTIGDLAPIEQPRRFERARAARARRTLAEAVQAAAASVVPSAFVRDRVVEVLGVDAARVAVVPWPLPPHADPTRIDTVRARYGIIGQIVLVPAPGPSGQAHLVAVRAMKHLAARHKDTTVVLLGGDVEPAKDVQEAVRSLGLAERVLHLGTVPDPVRSALYEHAAVVVDLAVATGFAHEVLEAMACGVPVIVADSGAAPELVGDAGAVVAPGDEAQLAVEVHRVLDDAGWRRRMVDAGLERARSSRAPRAAEALLATYRSVMAAL